MSKKKQQQKTRRETKCVASKKQDHTEDAQKNIKLLRHVNLTVVKILTGWALGIEGSQRRLYK